MNASVESMLINELANEIKTAIVEDGLSQKSAARQIGLGEAALNQWLKGTYKGNNDLVQESCTKWLTNRDIKRNAMPSLPTVGYVDTGTSEKIRAVLTMAQHWGTIGVVYGASGAGKTVTAKDYAATNPNVYLITCSPATNTVASILDEICEVLGIGRVAGKLAMQREILRRIKGSNGLMIFDESNHLGQTALEILRTLHDLSGIGIVFMGNEVVYSKFTGGKRSAEFAQLFGRISKPLHIIKPTLKDITALCGAWGITDKTSIEILKSIGQKNGGLRGMVHVLKQAYLYAAHGVPTPDDIKSSWEDIGSGGVDTIGDE